MDMVMWGSVENEDTYEGLYLHLEKDSDYADPQTKPPVTFRPRG